MKRKYDVLDDTPVEFNTLVGLANAYKELAEKMSETIGVISANIDIDHNDAAPFDSIFVRASTLHNIECHVLRDYTPGHSRPHKLRAVIGGVAFEAYCDDKEADYHEHKSEIVEDAEGTHKRFYCNGKNDFCDDNLSKCNSCVYFNATGGEYQ